jgi:[ribosomal protein S5]-alanine N-acetyltransferase
MRLRVQDARQTRTPEPHSKPLRGRAGPGRGISVARCALTGYRRAVPELQPLRADHAQAVLAFEVANRAYFAASISDRGDEFFDLFAARHAALLAEQHAGSGAFDVLAAEDGSILGRFNLRFTGDGTAELGYRVAQHVAGHGVATATVRELCHLAVVRHGLRTLRAATSHENAASQKVLIRAGFVPAGPADPADLGGKQGSWYQRNLAVS